MRPLRTLVVDDEPVARKGISRLLKEHPSVEVCGFAHSMETLEAAYEQQDPDLVILDIMLRHENSLNFFKSLGTCPLLIITTAFDQHALSGFSLKAVDYLLKPVSESKLQDALERAEKLFSPGSNGKETFYIRCDGRYVLVNTQEIKYVKGLQNYVVIHTTKGNYVTKSTLKGLWKHLDSQIFLQIHRSYIVNTNLIESFDASSIWIEGDELPLSRGYKDKVLERMLGM